MIIEFTIEGWTYQPYTDEILIPDEEFEDMTETERDAEIDQIVMEAVQNVVSWGWSIKE